MEKGLLEGVVVLDLTRVLAGPYCGMILADMGATVIKIENPTGGDDTRKMGPFINENSVYYANFNRSKVGCTLNLKEPEAKEIFKEFGRTFATYFTKPGVLLVIVFMLLYRLPEAFLIKMCMPFLVAARDAGGLGLPTAEVGIVYGTIGVIFSRKAFLPNGAFAFPDTTIRILSACIISTMPIVYANLGTSSSFSKNRLLAWIVSLVRQTRCVPGSNHSAGSLNPI